MSVNRRKKLRGEMLGCMYAEKMLDEIQPNTLGDDSDADIAERMRRMAPNMVKLKEILQEIRLKR